MEVGAATVVQLPPESSSTGSTTDSMYNGGPAVSSQPATAEVKGTATNNNPDAATLTHANIAKRNASREERKRELLIEARKARIDWILGGVTDDAKDLKEVLNGKKNPLRELQACAPDGVAIAPDVVEALFSSKLVGESDRNDTSSKIASEVKRILENERLSWENVSSASSCGLRGSGEKLADESEQTQIDQSAILLPPVPSTQSYNIFLQILCQPDAADVVFSMQKFCKTIEEAAKVILSVQEDEKQKEANAKLEKEKMMLQQDQHSLKSDENIDSEDADKGGGLHVRLSSEDATQPAGRPQKHAESLAKAVRGFIKTTLRDVQEHDAFKMFPKGNGDETDAVNEELMACLETFVLTKCHSPIYRVLGSELDHVEDHGDNMQTESLKEQPKSVEESENELSEKIKLLQFVTPVHLEIQCLKVAPADDVDLSYTIKHLQSIKQQSSPRQKLRSILLAYRGINASLNALLNKQKGTTPSPSPPSADDVLPTLILAVLRAQPEKILTDLRMIEFFANVSLLRGEAGYAYTNLCGAVQFLSKLDMEGHAAEVSLGEEGAHLSISPDDFRAGIEQSKQTMKLVEGKISKEKPDGEDRDVNIHADIGIPNHTLYNMKISGRDIRDARYNGETIDIEWALRKQKEMGWHHGNTGSDSPPMLHAPISNSNLPPEEPPLPANFNRSYSYLSTRPDDIRISDLPKLLNEYRLLVHATESLLNERSAWREAEKRRQMLLARSSLEKEFDEVIGSSFSSEIANGSGNKS